MKHNISRLMLRRYQHQQYHPRNLANDPTFEWMRYKSGLPWLELSIDVPADQILNEIYNIQDMLVPHRDDYAEHQGWESFCIHGRGHDLTREDSQYPDAPDHHWTREAKDLMPQTVKFFQTSWPGQEYQRLRVMRLRPGGYISMHADQSAPGLAPINIAITQPDQCYFVMEKHGCVPFGPGKSFWLDVSNNHAVFNDSDQDRWHIIVHQSLNHPDFRDLVAKSYNLLYNRYNEIL